jgi:hypothetical protein
MSLQIETPKTDEIRDGVRQIASAQTRLRLNAALGKRVEIELRGHFARRPRNKRGWPAQGFWRKRIRNATKLEHYDEHGAEIRIADPAMNQKVFGGTIRPIESKYLTLPARPEAYGRSPRTFSGLKFVPLRGRGRVKGMLVMPRRAFSKRGKKGLDVYYYCVTEVNQEPDADALPAEVVMTTAITDETGKFFSRELKRTGGGR